MSRKSPAKPSTLFQTLGETTEQKFDGYIEAIRGAKASAALFASAMETLRLATDGLEDNMDKLRDLADPGPVKDEYWALRRHIEDLVRKRRSIEIGLITIQTDHVTDKLYRRIP